MPRPRTPVIRLFGHESSFQAQSAAARFELRKLIEPLLAAQFDRWSRDRSTHGNLLLSYGFEGMAARSGLIFHVSGLDVVLRAKAIEARGRAGTITADERADPLYVPMTEASWLEDGWRLCASTFAWIGSYEQWVFDNFDGQRPRSWPNLRKQWWLAASLARQVAAAMVSEAEQGRRDS